MLVGMAVRAMGTVCQGLEGTVVPFAPAVDILPVQVVADGGFCDTMLVGILNYVGLSMMCYTLWKANKTCFGERQAKGRMGKLLYARSRTASWVLKSSKL